MFIQSGMHHQLVALATRGVWIPVSEINKVELSLVAILLL
jgi:hypothetical protein